MTVTQDDTRIALIGNDISYMKKAIDEVKQSVKELAGVYATQESLKDIEKQVKSLADSVKMINDRQSGWQRFFPSIFASVLTGVLVFLVISFLTNAK